MADFVAVLKKTLDGLGETTPEMRAKVYDKARSTIAAKLAAMNPPPPAAVVAERQKRALEDAIAADREGIRRRRPRNVRSAGRTRERLRLAEERAARAGRDCYQRGSAAAAPSRPPAGRCRALEPSVGGASGRSGRRRASARAAAGADFDGAALQPTTIPRSSTIAAARRSRLAARVRRPGCRCAGSAGQPRRRLALGGAAATASG